ncbi:hypothetical protein E4K73_37200 [Streptomyces sp. IB201691-2A2]|nr:hypothetical protein E4K73_37200 [Streptomyces sp. IB201691-2A2]
MATSERDVTRPSVPVESTSSGVAGVAGVSMRELLAAGVFARAVSTPPAPPAAPVRESRPRAA